MKLKSLEAFRQLVLAALVGLPLAAFGQQSASDDGQAAAGVLEEIVVTARKRDESLQDVPVAIQAVPGAFITEQGVMDVQTLAPYTPNFGYATAVGAADLMFMRGVGNFGAGPQFEPSVGQVFDGYFISRSRLGRSAFLDIGQVEILKGPQGAIIGKNTSLGAVSVTPAKPTEEFESTIRAGLGSGDQAGTEVGYVLSGPLSSGLRARLAVEYRDLDGFVENTNPLASYDNAGSDETFAGRLILQADISDTWSAEVLAQTTDTTREGKHRDIIFCPGPDSLPSSAADKKAAVEAQGATCSRDQTTHAVAFDSAEDDANVLSDELTINTTVLGLRFDWQLGDINLTSLTGISDYEIIDAFDSDQTAQKLTQFINTEDYSQTTQEVRISGEAGRADYIAGFFWMTSELDFDQITDFPSNGWRRNQPAKVETDTLSLFAQADWSLSDAWTATTGLRWTSESRDGQYHQFPTMAFTSERIPCAAGPRACSKQETSDADSSQLTGTIDEDNVSGNLAITRSLGNGIVYASWASGNKSAGFAIVSALSPDAFEFEGEETTQIEIGGKHEFLGNTLRFNWAYYDMSIEGLQTAALDPTVSVPVNTPVNADATSDGLEIDLTWVSGDFTLSWTAGWSNAVWDGFSGDCWSGQSEGCTGGKQNLDGKSLPLAPELSHVLGADYHWPMGNIDARVSVKLINTSDYITQLDHHPQATQDASNKIDVALTFAADNWSVAVVGKNITDEITYQFSATPPNVAGTGGGHPRVLNAFPEPGSSFAVRFAYDF